MSEEKNEKLYLKGFNSGYQLSQYEPELLNQLLETENAWSSYIGGLRDGKTEFLREKGLEKLSFKSSLTNSDYQKGFNQGYYIAKYEPELAKQLSKLSGEHEHIIGLQQGKEQYLKEISTRRLPSWLKDDPFKEHEQSPEKDKDKGIEPEMD